MKILPAKLRIVRLGVEAFIDWDAPIVVPPDGFDGTDATVEQRDHDADQGEHNVTVRWSPMRGVACDEPSWEYPIALAKAGDLVLVPGPNGRHDLAWILERPTGARFRLTDDGLIEMTPDPATDPLPQSLP